MICGDGDKRSNGPFWDCRLDKNTGDSSKHILYIELGGGYIDKYMYQLLIELYTYNLHAICFTCHFHYT